METEHFVIDKFCRWQNAYLFNDKSCRKSQKKVL